MLHPTPDEIAYMQAHASDDRRAPFVGVNIACLVLAFVAVSLRVIARIKIGTKIGLDDWLIILAAVSSDSICGLSTMPSNTWNDCSINRYLQWEEKGCEDHRTFQKGN